MDLRETEDQLDQQVEQAVQEPRVLEVTEEILVCMTNPGNHPLFDANYVSPNEIVFAPFSRT